MKVTEDPQYQARLRAEKIADELAILVAHEHRRAKEERARREEAEQTIEQLAALIANEHAEVERERAARERAEEEARDLSALVFERRSSNIDRSTSGVSRLTRRRRFVA